VSQAFLIARHKSQYKNVAQNAIAMAFFGTPHHGVDLDKLLASAPSFKFAKTRYFKDLSPRSQAIKEINEGFAENCSKLFLASFWENRGVDGVGVFLCTIDY